MNAVRNIGRLAQNNSCLFVCDLQEKFRNQIFCFPQIIEVSKRLINAAKILELPIIVTEQYPKGLGHTVAELELEKNQLKPIEKSQFSMCLPDISKQLQQNNIKNVIVCGIETHVCVQGTALDLLEKGFDVHIVVDACSSRTKVNRMFALERMKQSGAFLTTSESAILGLVGGSSHPKFRDVQKLIIENAPDSELV